ncbi:hypothetical protein L1765_06110 [Microaerobacter geothermalis]|uniref:cbb3-type cytochrome oxidase assembly protein n=1 Tax=Microaerobacter geothermalis TaxID=674972 RepID=UPI001F1874BF|nr:hypothetical protein [Microaerobacter geothermalis]MCF6093560.1 hypothetical protein [Microaerobacter geothermalis]
MLLGLTIGAWIILIVMISFTGSSILIWAWARKSGQFDESIKYRMLDDDDN